MEIINHYDKCAPSHKFSDNSCFSLESLKIITNAYNNNFPNNKININLTKAELVKELLSKIKECGKNQLCWLKIKWIKDINDYEINYHTFRPKGPQGRFTWLNTTDINTVIEQYELVHKNFKFFGAVPVDFAELSGLEISSINFSKLLNNGINKFAMVINFDTHRQRGSHWVALYVDLLKSQIYYFDSYGTPPKDKRITNFVKRVSLWLHKKYILKSRVDNINDDTDDTFMKDKKNKYEMLSDLDIQYNKKRHQRENSECGVYSINCILRLLKNETFENICKNITPDREINKCRYYYFGNTNKETYFTD